jgi:regulator of RNase E activity RraA
MQADRSRNPNRVAVDQTQPSDVLVPDGRGVTPGDIVIGDAEVVVVVPGELKPKWP